MSDVASFGEVLRLELSLIEVEAKNLVDDIEVPVEVLLEDMSEDGRGESAVGASLVISSLLASLKYCAQSSMR